MTRIDAQPLLLSTTAENLYWIGRYLERTEQTARVVASHSELNIDLPGDASTGWRPLLRMIGAAHDWDLSRGDEGVPTTIDEETETGVISYLTSDSDSPNSIRSAIAAMHFNLRLTRPVVPVEAAQALTELHLHVELTSHEAINRRTRTAWLTSVMRGCQTLSGILSDTMIHDDAYYFYAVGRQLERADMTIRTIDVETPALIGNTPGPFAHLGWAAVLRSVSALQAFRRSGVDPSPGATIGFLLLDRRCPRSVMACFEKANLHLAELPRNEAARQVLGSLIDGLAEVDAEALVKANEVGSFLDTLELGVAEQHRCIEQTWFAPRHDDEAEAEPRAESSQSQTQTQSQTSVAAEPASPALDELGNAT